MDYITCKPVITCQQSTNTRTNFTLSAYPKRTVLAKNGIYTFANPNRYFYFRGNNDSNDLFEIRLGNFMFRMTTAGLQKSSDGGQNWTTI